MSKSPDFDITAEDPHSLKVTQADKPILAGLFLSKFDTRGLQEIGFDTFKEAFNVLGYAVGAPPSSIKNYRDEFDPLFSTRRKGWHKRPRRENCLRVLRRFKDLDIEFFASIIKSFGSPSEDSWSDFQTEDGDLVDRSQFASRLITGAAAENYFQKTCQRLEEFKGYHLENTTQLGCGYDFRLHAPDSADFLAVEVKGMKGRSGAVSLTPKEYEMAMHLRERFFLFVVKNFEELPFHVIFRNPLSSFLQFMRTERTIVQISWSAKL